MNGIGLIGFGSLGESDVVYGGGVDGVGRDVSWVRVLGGGFECVDYVIFDSDYLSHSGP